LKIKTTVSGSVGREYDVTKTQPALSNRPNITGSAIKIPARTTVKFRLAKAAKDAVVLPKP